MNTYTQDQPNRDFEGRNSTGDTGTSVQGADGEIAARIPELARQALEQARKIPSLIDTELRDNPYRLLGIVGGIGVGVGMLVGSRIMRTIVMSVGGYAVSETLRNYVNEALQKNGPDTH